MKLDQFIVEIYYHKFAYSNVRHFCLPIFEKANIYPRNFIFVLSLAWRIFFFIWLIPYQIQELGQNENFL